MLLLPPPTGELCIRRGEGGIALTAPEISLLQGVGGGGGCRPPQRLLQTAEKGKHRRHSFPERICTVQEILAECVSAKRKKIN